MFNFPIWPEQASSFAFEYDLLFIVESALMVFFTVLVTALIVFFGYKYRRGSKASRKNPVHHHGPLEYGSIGVLIVLSLFAFAWAAKLYASIYTPPADAMEIFVIGKQWMWHLQHANGVRENNELHIPIGRPVKMTMISQDVLHAFFIPAFRIKRDLVPGRFTDCWFIATKPGKWHLFCAEYCGTQHSEMGGWVYAMQPDDFERWLNSGGARGPENGGPKLPATMAEKGKVLYDQLACGNCHDPDGIQRGPLLAGLYGKMVKLKDGRTVKADMAYLRNSIINPNEAISEGYQQIMPSYKGQVTEEQVLHLIAYMRSLGEAPGAAPPPSAGPSASGAAHAAPPATAGSATPAAQPTQPPASGLQPAAGDSNTQQPTGNR